MQLENVMFRYRVRCSSRVVPRKQEHPAKKPLLNWKTHLELIKNKTTETSKIRRSSVYRWPLLYLPYTIYILLRYDLHIIFHVDPVQSGPLAASVPGVTIYYVIYYCLGHLFRFSSPSPHGTVCILFLPDFV